MGRNPRFRNLSHETVAEPSDNGLRRGPAGISTRHTLLTQAWTGDVQAIQAAIGRFKTDRPLTNDCEVVLFEMAGDPHLHVNVMHKHPTAEMNGWAGPGSVPYGFVHNRRFVDTPPHQIIRHIREMVFAARI